MGVCANCSHPNPEAAKFCERCGSPLVRPGEAQRQEGGLGGAPEASAKVRSIKAEGPTPDLGQTQRVARPSTAGEQKLLEPEPVSSQPTAVSGTAPKHMAPEPAEPPKRRRSKLPFILGGIAALLLVCCGGGATAVYLGGISLDGFLGGLTSSNAKWAGADTSVDQVLAVDLSSLGLTKVTEVDKSDMTSFQDAAATDGRQVVFALHNNASAPTVAVTALKYADRDTAGSDFQAYVDSPPGVKNSTKSVNTLSHNGTASFEFAQSFERLQWNDYWIIHIVVLTEQTQNAAGLRDKIWDKLGEHLKTIK